MVSYQTTCRGQTRVYPSRPICIQFKEPNGGGFQPTYKTLFFMLDLLGGRVWVISWERVFILSMTVGAMKGWASTTYLLRPDHMDHTARGRVMDQGLFSWDGMANEEVDMCFSHSVRLRLKKSGGSELFERPCHMGRMLGQSLRIWIVVSEYERQRGHESSFITCLLRGWFFVWRRSWHASHRNVFTLGRVCDFQSQFQAAALWVKRRFAAKR